MSLNSYDFNEQVKLLPRNFNVIISDNDKVISIEENGALVAVLSLALEGETLKLMGKDNMEISSVELPKAQTLDKAYYDKDTQELVLVVNMGEGEVNEIRVDVSELVDVYQEGNGIMIDEEKKIHVKIAKLSQGILNADEEGLAINLSDYATEDDVKEEARLREKYDDELREDLKNEARIRENEDNAQWEAINKIVDDSAAISAEVARAMKAEANLQTNINVETEERKLDVAALQGNINAEVETRKLDVTNLQNNINAEVETRKLDVAALQANINAETEARKVDVAELQDNINAEVETRKLDVAALQTNINAETEARKVDVTNLQNNINALSNSTQEQFANVDAKINEEIDKRVASDNILENKIIEESITRSEEDAKLKEAIDAISSGSVSGLEEEARLRAEGDKQLGDNITKVEEKLTEELSKKVPFTKVMKDGVEYDVIILDNHANLLGYDSGHTATFNIAMISKWNKVDLGTASLPINLNGSEERPTYNDDKEIAFTSDIASLGTSIMLIKKSDLEYALMVGEQECGTISIPKDQFLKEVTYSDETHILSFVFNTVDGESKTDIDFSQLVDVYTAGNGLNLSSNAFSIVIDTNTQKYIEVSSDGLKIVGVDEELAKKVDWTDISTPELQGRKAIILKNHDTILGTNTSGSTASIAMISKWDIVDLGTTSLPINLNTPKGVRPTVQEAGQSGEEANQIAYLSDIEAVKEELNNINDSTQDSLNKKVDWTDISTEDNPNRKSIVLNNHDMILGRTTSGDTNNIAMISKWDKVDLGTASLPINLNTPKGVRPTVQEAGQSGEEANQIAYLSDVKTLLGNEQSLSSEMSIYGVRKYVDEQVGGVGANFDERFDEIHSKFDLYETVENAVQSHDEILGESKSYTDSRIGDEKLDTIAQAVNQSKEYTNSKVAEVKNVVESNTNRITSIEGRCDHFDDLFGMILDEHGDPINLKFYTKQEIDDKVKVLDEKDAELTKNIENKVDWTDISTEGMEGRKAIVLKNHDTILGTNTSGSTASIAMINKWDVVDLGTTKLPINLNTPKGVRPTVQEAGQSGEEANQIAYLSDIEAVKEELNNINDSTQDSLNKKVDWTDISTEDNPNRKSIVLNNHDLILGRTTSGDTKNIAMISKWDVVDLGTTTLPINLNTPKGVRPTVQEAGQSGEEANQIAYLSDINTVNSTILNLNTTDNLILSRLTVLEEKLAALQKTNIQEVTLDSESGVDFNDDSKDYIISGEETKSTKIQGKTVKLDNLAISNNARTSLISSDVELKNVKLSGDFPKENGNSVININNAEYIVVKDMIFDSSNLYNGIEIGLSSSTLPKSILFENCQFLGKFSNNAILIFGTQDNAVININNCYFQDLSNPFRLSNKTNSSCTMNITNCKFDKWDVTSPWQGMLLMQDYTSGDAEKANANNLFAPEKITINVINCIGPNNKKITMPSDIATVCATGNESQLFYIWDNYRNLVHYEKTKYPTINIL